LDGGTAMKDRQLIVDRFKQSQKDFIFLISTKAGVRG
jgi:SNF2 family DNA or RNA helicase